MSDPRFDPVLRDALDRFTVPPLSAGFIDRVVAVAMGPAKPLPLAVAPRRDRRGSWVRGHRVIIGVVAFGLMSAAAAATAIFPDMARTIPVIGTLIAHVTPARHDTKPKKAIAKKPAIVKPNSPEAPALVDALPLATPTVVPLRREIRREFVAQRIADRLEQRAERRAELGLPPRPPRPARILPVLRRLPPQDRAAVVERVREIRQEQRAAQLAMPDADAGLPARAPALTAKRDLPPVLVESGATPLPTEPQAGETLAKLPRAQQLERLQALQELRQRRREMRRLRMQQ